MTGPPRRPPRHRPRQRPRSAWALTALLAAALTLPPSAPAEAATLTTAAADTAHAAASASAAQTAGADTGQASAAPGWGNRAVAPLAPPERALPGTVAAPQVRAEAYLLADLTTGQVLAGRNSDQPRPMASTTKIMTALLALERLQLDRVVTVTPEAAGIGGAGLRLEAGERLTVQQLLTGLLVPSANDAAAALAHAAAGSVGGFVQQMNGHARRLGLTRTRFANPHGLDAPGHHSSARDLARLWMTALQNETFAALAATPSARLPGPQGPREIVSTNELLGDYQWLDGGKTGFTDGAGRCLVASATRGGRHLVAVVLGSPDAFPDARALLEYGFSGFVRARLAESGGTVRLDGRDWFTTLDDVDALVRRDLLGAAEIELPAQGDAAASLRAGGQRIGPVAVGDVRAAAGAAVTVAPQPAPPGAEPSVIDEFLRLP